MKAVCSILTQFQSPEHVAELHHVLVNYTSTVQVAGVWKSRQVWYMYIDGGFFVTIHVGLLTHSSVNITWTWPSLKVATLLERISFSENA